MPLWGFSKFLEQGCFEVIDVSKYKTKLLTQKNLKILKGNEERMHAQANSSLVAIYVFITLACWRVLGIGALLPALPVQQALRWVSLTSFPPGDVVPVSREGGI